MERILYNGKICTMEEGMPTFSAVGISCGKISALGTDEEILSLSNKDTERIDLKGRLVLPGFNDSHMHLLYYSVLENMVDLSEVKSFQELSDTIKKYIKEQNKTPGTYIYGKNWNHENWVEKRMPTRFDLDKISSEHPILLTRVCTHIVAVNTKMLEVTHLMKQPPIMEDGKFDIDEDGLPNGIVRENAVGLLYKDAVPPSMEELKEMILFASGELVKKGITSVQTDDLGSVFGASYEMVLQAFEELSEEKLLPLRVNEQARFLTVEGLSGFIDSGRKTGSGNESFRIGPVKLFLDGSLGARTAFMRKAYADDPGTRGISVLSESELEALVHFAHENDMQTAIHCIGDGAIEMAINCFEKLLKNQSSVNGIGENRLRHGIVHAQITDKRLIERMGKLGLLAYIQPVFVQSDYKIVESRVGKDLAEYSYGWNTMRKEGVILCGGSDSPVEAFDILPNIYCAVTRKDYEGYPKEGWNEKEKLPLWEAVRCFTAGGAYASFEENIKGTLEKGKMADMVVLDKDIFNISEEDIKNTKVLLTVVGGKTQWKSRTF